MGAAYITANDMGTLTHIVGFGAACCSDVRGGAHCIFSAILCVDVLAEMTPIRKERRFYPLRLRLAAKHK